MKAYITNLIDFMLMSVYFVFFLCLFCLFVWFWFVSHIYWNVELFFFQIFSVCFFLLVVGFADTTTKDPDGSVVKDSDSYKAEQSFIYRYALAVLVYILVGQWLPPLNLIDQMHGSRTVLKIPKQCLWGFDKPFLDYEVLTSHFWTWQSYCKTDVPQ